MNPESGLTIESSAIIRALPQLCLILSPEFTILEGSDAYLQATLITRKESLGKHLFEVFPDNPDTPEANAVANLRRSLERVLETGAEDRMPIQHYDIQRPAEEGRVFETRYWKPCNSPVLDNEGKVLYIIHSVEDVTREILSELELLESVRQQEQIESQIQLLLRMFEQAPAIICVLKGPDHVYDMVNDRHVDFINNRDVVGKTIREAFPELETQGLIKILDEVYETGQPFVASEVRLEIDRKGHGYSEECYFNLMYQPIFNEQEEVISILALMIDVTEQVENRRQIENNEKWVRLILETIPHIAWTAKPDGKCCDYFNRKWHEYTGIEVAPDSVFGWEAITHPEDLPTLLADWERAISLGVHLQSEVRFKNAEGDYRWFSVRATPLKDEDTITAWVGTSTDIHDQKIVSEKLEAAALQQTSSLNRAQKDITRFNADNEQFVHVASHDLKEPLRMISNYTDLLVKKYSDVLDADGKEFMRFVKEGTKKMGNLISDLLAYSIIGRETNSQANEVDCNAVVEETKHKLWPQIVSTGARIESSGLPVIKANQAQISKLFYHLIENALKFRGEAVPEISISATREDALWHFIVEDNGIGIDPQYAQKIFVIFQKLHNGEHAGTGIGLPICKKIVELHGGEIWAAKSSKGKGAAFHFTISS